MTKDTEKWGEDKAKDISKGGSQVKGDDRKGWANYAREHNYIRDKAEARRNIGTEGAGKDYNQHATGDWRQPQKDSQGKGWRHFSDVSKRNSYTGKGGSRRG